MSKPNCNFLPSEQVAACRRRLLARNAAAQDINLEATLLRRFHC